MLHPRDLLSRAHHNQHIPDIQLLANPRLVPQSPSKCNWAPKPRLKLAHQYRKMLDFRWKICQSQRLVSESLRGHNPQHFGQGVMHFYDIFRQQLVCNYLREEIFLLLPEVTATAGHLIALLCPRGGKT